MSVNIIGAAIAKRSRWPVSGAKNRPINGFVNAHIGFVMEIVLDVWGDKL